MVWVVVKAISETTASEIFVSVSLFSSEIVAESVVVAVSVSFLKEGWSHIWDINCVLNNFEVENWFGNSCDVFLNVEVSVVGRVEGVDGVAGVGVAVGAAIGVETLITGLMSVVTKANTSVICLIKSTVAIAAAIDSSEVATIAEIVESVGVSSISESRVSLPFGCAFERTETTVGSKLSTSVVATIATWSEFTILTIVIIVAVIGLKWIIRFGVHNDVTKSISEESDFIIVRVINVDSELSIVVSDEATSFT